MFEEGISLAAYLMLSDYYFDLSKPVSYPWTNTIGGFSRGAK